MLNFFRNLKKRLRLNRWVRRSMSTTRSEPEASPSRIPSVTENQASTSNVSCTVKPSLEPTCDTAHPAPSHSTNRSELVGVLNGSTQGEVGKQSQPQDILKRKMEHPLNTANMRETEDSKLPNPAENPDTFLGGPSTVLQPHTFETLPRQSEEACADQDLSNSSNSDLSASQITDSQYRSIPSYHPHVPQLNASAASGGAPAELSQHPNQTLTIDGANRIFMALLNQTEASSSRFSFSQSRPSLEELNRRHLSIEIFRAHSLYQWATTNHLNNLAQRWDKIYKNLLLLKASSKDASGPKSRSSKELSPDDEGDLCRICLDVYVSADDPLLSPCLCSGSLKFVHSNCLKTWIQIQLQSGRSRFVVQRCELCKGVLNVDKEMFRCEDRNRTQRQVELNPLIPRQRSRNRNSPYNRTYSIHPVYQHHGPYTMGGFRRTGARFFHPESPNTAAQNPSNVDSVHPNTDMSQ